jgi:hypothetical protein
MSEENKKHEQGGALAAIPTTDKPTIWNNTELMQLASRQANMLAQSGLVPDSYKNSPANCLIAIDMANRMNIPPLMVMQNLYVVKGKPAWSGAFCAALINGSGKFTPLKYTFVGEKGKPTYGCYASATRISNGEKCCSDTITMQMATDEGWISKPGSKWKTMPVQMMMYRAASFFAKAHCAELVLGLSTVEEMQDITEDPSTIPTRGSVWVDPVKAAGIKVEAAPEKVNLRDV